MGKRDYEWECENNRQRCDFSKEIFTFAALKTRFRFVSNIGVSRREKLKRLRRRVFTRTSCFILGGSIRSQSLPGETGNTLYIACLSKRMCI